MRYLIDTNIIVYMISDPDLLDKDVKELIAEPDALLYASAESAKELVVSSSFRQRWNIYTRIHAWRLTNANATKTLRII